jgi:hypothetical protein
MIVEGTFKFAGGDGKYRGITGGGRFKSVMKSETEKAFGTTAAISAVIAIGVAILPRRFYGAPGHMRERIYRTSKGDRIANGKERGFTCQRRNPC